ncbi:gluconate 2-dehydrogenase subunit 3 family protein [Microbulbifer salipaludis]|uniref:Gluconate 2-dehydrogenase subunit 3 family protein n=1 Tax=Microbulbifer salipaludis TaxID=187980 RepID=A0ABS3E6L9_9GAMM|nr:gluconate 2-dehydrogenase subunit 3 family protein [Microbulbifer salipaludis]MBN8430954.1 gluconate 2-dehydrogenase subunit 3 family protein [Microbulbifer salipaludis]
MDRRDFLLGMSAILGCSVPSLDVAALESALKFSGQSTGFLRDIELSYVSRIADTIIPETDTPSASQVGVADYIDFYLHDFLPARQAQQFVLGLHGMTGSMQEFLTLSVDRQLAVIQDLDDRLDTDQENSTFKKLKELVVIGYYTSQAGATQALGYDPIPGPYKEIKLAEVGRAWL